MVRSIDYYFSLVSPWAYIGRDLHGWDARPWRNRQLTATLQKAVDTMPAIFLNSPAWALSIIVGGGIYILGLVGVRIFDESILKHDNAG
jgi:hypothetical protein